MNPKKPGTKSADLYDLYKSASSVREMLALGGRRGDVSYDISHGWIEFEDPGLQLRFAGAPAALAPATAPASVLGKKRLHVQLPAADSSSGNDAAAGVVGQGEGDSHGLDAMVLDEPAQVHPFDS